MSVYKLETVAEIMQSLDVGETIQMIKSQIENPDDDYITPVIDIFQPVYNNYKDLLDITETEDPEDISIAKDNFFMICRNIIDAICEKYDMSIDDDYLDDNREKLVGITLGLYSFMIKDFYAVTYEIIKNYFVENMVALYDVFKGISMGKDAVSSSNMKRYSLAMATLMTNIYDIADYIFTMIDQVNVFDYIDPGYIPLVIIRNLYNKGVLSGNFVRVFADIFKDNIPLRSKICFEILYQIKNETIEDIFKRLPVDKEN